MQTDFLLKLNNIIYYTICVMQNLIQFNLIAKNIYFVIDLTKNVRPCNSKFE